MRICVLESGDDLSSGGSIFGKGYLLACYESREVFLEYYEVLYFSGIVADIDIAEYLSDDDHPYVMCRSNKPCAYTDYRQDIITVELD